MTTLLYRGHSYVQHKELKDQKDCVELTYRRSHYNTCKSDSKSELNTQMSYRGLNYQLQSNKFDFMLCQAGPFFSQFILSWIYQLLLQAKLIFFSPHKVCMQMLLDDFYILCPRIHLQFHSERCKRSLALNEYRLTHF